MISVVASITVKEGKREEFLEIFHGNVPKVRNEEGCVEYFPAIDADSGIGVQTLDPQVVTVMEKWQSMEALHRHLESAHMLEYREKVKDLVEGVSLKVLRQA
ncbi:antibiotic biosynthesis monooxygenase domain protein [Citrifermentans bemidjiense Bem]|uniref:Antibiotic biosynthesis monooxygenase domain protein n=1 Tax=Citrifermentans bemidjiense (strain ATCC BAA-1014 / DSM 16622 / JCM 12645 / Bem) TaxID=404380 RepID=B5EEJ7_CITBB|nr:putative quinol monooxygenase [Citrifermentans bemidjiense]ACH40783.1 antibiotic biosynthesis monooxygenase domain protein [Citrifermentans bemidjiense Bem]